MIKNFRHTCIIVRDLDRALRFYRDMLGLKVAKTVNVEGQYPETALNIKGIKITYVKLRSPDQPEDSPPVLELHHWKNPKISPTKGYSHISFTVDDIEQEYKRLSESGVRFISRPVKAPHGSTKICFGYDPDDNLIEFVEVV